MWLLHLIASYMLLAAHMRIYHSFWLRRICVPDFGSFVANSGLKPYSTLGTLLSAQMQHYLGCWPVSSFPNFTRSDAHSLLFACASVSDFQTNRLGGYPLFCDDLLMIWSPCYCCTAWLAFLSRCISSYTALTESDRNSSRWSGLLFGHRHLIRAGIAQSKWITGPENDWSDLLSCVWALPESFLSTFKSLYLFWGKLLTLRSVFCAFAAIAWALFILQASS